MNFPDELRYSSDHEWARVEGGRVRIGITDYAQDALGDVVFVQLPETGSTVAAGDSDGDGVLDSDAELMGALESGTAMDLGVVASFTCPVIPLRS